MNIKGLISDLDNTLFWSSHYVRSTLVETGAKFGLQIPSEEIVKTAQKKNLPFEKLFDELFGLKGPEVLAQYRTIAKVKPMEPTPYSVKIIEGLYSAGLVIGAVTNRTTMVYERLEQCGFHKDHFAFVHTPPSPELAKPHPQAYEKAISELAAKGILESQIAVLGDHPDDYKSAKARNLHFVGVLTGDTTKEDFLNAGLEARFILPDLSGLPALLQTF